MLLSQSDYRTIADRKWDKEGISRMNKMQEGSDYGTTSKEGFWSYDGTEMDFDPIKGSSTRFEVVMVQKFHYNKAGTGKENRRDVQTTSRINTGIIIEKKDKYTYQSTNVK